MSAHSQSSSLADVDYYTPSYTHSPSQSSSSLTNGSALPSAANQQYTSSSARTSAHGEVRKSASLAQISVPSFSAFRSQASSIPVSSSPSTIRRKPAPFQAHSPRAPSLSVAEQPFPRLADLTSRPLSLDSQVPQQSRGLAHATFPPLTEELPERVQERQPNYTFPPASHRRDDSIDSRIVESNPSSSVYGGESRRSSIPIHAKYAQEHTISHAPKQSASSIDFASHYSPAVRLSAVSSMNGKQEPPEMKLELDGVQRTLTDESLDSVDSSGQKKPKSPRGLGNFFSWKGSSQKSPISESPTTTFSDRSVSPLPSPHLRKPSGMEASPAGARLTPPGLDIHKANSGSHTDYVENLQTPILLGTPQTNAHVEELERELAQVSTELAGSIRREMDLEDEVERMKAEIPTIPPSEMGRRTSDYFSDSGASNARFPVTDIDGKLEQLERQLRKVEQERAQTKVEMASRLQTELSRRRDLEQMVQHMEEQLQKKFDEEDERGDMEERVEELESTLEDTRRLLNQERQAKGSFEDLYSATRGELEQHRNERDNLRDEVVPQLKARVEGLEQEAADTQALMYEHTRMQQELVTLKGKMHGRFGSIQEEDDGRPPSPSLGGPRMALSRSGSLARSTSKRGGSLTRTGSMKEGTQAGRGRSSSLNGGLSAEAAKELEDQRDALHKSLKLLLTRHDRQQKEHERAIKKLTSAKTLAESSSPNRTAYHKEVSFLKDEVATLRKRTEDALEQKWQYEKGLSGIKMDLDRAELETRGLRIILQEHDILSPSTRTRLGDDLERESADDKLKISISTAESERDQARQMAEEYRRRASLAEDDSSAALMDSAKRMDELADELDKQVQSNIQLRARLAEAVAKGEAEQRESNGKIAEMQKRLTIMEDSVLAAQQHSETTLNNHESEVRKLEQSSSPRLNRLTITVPEPKNKRLTAPPSPFLNGPRSPKIGSKKLSETSLLEMSRTQLLERKVKDLEGLLREAEGDMQEVVQRVNQSQLEVAELQTERDSALSQMSKLQGLIAKERERAEKLMP